MLGSPRSGRDQRLSGASAIPGEVLKLNGSFAAKADGAR
jgi:hypothetical protein